MRNLSLLSVRRGSLPVPSESSIAAAAVDSENERVYLVTSCGRFFGTSLHATPDDDYFLDVDLGEDLEEGVPRPSSRALSLNLELGLATVVDACGRIDTIQLENGEVDSVGGVEGGSIAATWSPDEEIFSIVSARGTVLLMSQEFEPLNEFSLPLEPMEAGCPSARMSWRGDSKFLSVLYGSTVVILTREGSLVSKGEEVKGIGTELAWKPSGAIIAASQRQKHRNDVIFFEKNGLRHGEFSLRSPDAIVEELAWNSNSELLGVLSSEFCSSAEGDRASPDTAKRKLSLWYRENYHWYLKYEMELRKEGSYQLLWKDLNALSFVLVHPDGDLENFCMTWRQTVSKPSRAGNTEPFDLLSKAKRPRERATIAVVDGDAVILTHAHKELPPPPMSSEVVKSPSAIFDVVFGQRGELITLSGNGEVRMLPLRQEIAPENSIYDILSCTSHYTVQDEDILSRWITIYNVSPSDYVKEVCAFGEGAIALSIVRGSGEEGCLILTSPDGQEYTENKWVLFEEGILRLCTGIVTGNLYIETANGDAYVLITPSFDKRLLSDIEGRVGRYFEVQCEEIATFTYRTREGRREVLVGRTQGSGGCCTIGGHVVAREVTSMATHERHILLTTRRNALCFLHYPEDESEDTSIEMQPINENALEYGIDDLQGMEVPLPDDPHHIANSQEVLLGLPHSHVSPMLEVKEKNASFPLSVGFWIDKRSERALEAGSRLIAAVGNSSFVVLQMPRGNLEGIYPRALVLDRIRSYLSLSPPRFKDAFREARRHRVNLNFLYDFKPQSVLANAELFVKEIGDAGQMNVFIGAITDEDVTRDIYPMPTKATSDADEESLGNAIQKEIDAMLKEGPRSDKTTIVCECLRKAMESVSRETYLLPILLTYVKRSPPMIEDALRDVQMLVRREMEMKRKIILGDDDAEEENLSGMMRMRVNSTEQADRTISHIEGTIDVRESTVLPPEVGGPSPFGGGTGKASIDRLPTAEEALEHLLFLTGERELYKASLASYDLTLAALVANKTQMDPKEYRPFLQRLATLPSDARKVDIELYLERFDRALIHSIACGEIRMEATMKLIEQKNLYMKAIEEYDRRGKRVEANAVRKQYACKLKADSKDELAAAMFAAVGEHLEAAMCYEKARDWTLAIAHYRAANVPSEDLKGRISTIIEFLQEHEGHTEAARLFDEELNDEEQAITEYLNGKAYTDAHYCAARHNRWDLLETLIVPALRSGAEDLQKLLQSHRMELKQKLERIVVVRNNKIAAPSLEVTANANLLRELDDDALSGIFSVTSTLSTLSMSTYTSSLASCKGSSRVSGTSKGSKKLTDRKKRRREKREQTKEGGRLEEAHLMKGIANLYPSLAMNTYYKELIKGLHATGLHSLAAETIGTFDEYCSYVEKVQKILRLQSEAPLSLPESVFVVEDDEEKRVPLPPLPLAIAPKGKLVLVDPPPKYTPPLLGDLRGSTN